MKLDVLSQYSNRAVRIAVIGLVAAVLAGCSMFGPPKIKEEPIVPAAALYQGVIEEGLEFLRKPFTPTELARKIRSILDAK